MKRKPHPDPVTPEVYEHVRRRDFWQCIAPVLPLAPGALEPCDGPIQLDHIHGSGLSKRGPSRAWNLASLCRHHHDWKTKRARAWRERLDWYVLTFEKSARTDPEAAKYLPVAAW